MPEAAQDYYVELSFAAHPTDTLEQATDALMEALMDINTIADQGILACLSDGTIHVSLCVTAQSNPAAVEAAEQAFAEAIHLSGAPADWAQQATATATPRSRLAADNDNHHDLNDIAAELGLS